MRRVLEPGQIEAYAQRTIPRLRLPDRATVFSRRAERLRELAAAGAIGHAIGDYLRLMAHVVEAQHAALRAFDAGSHWRSVLPRICNAIAALPDLPAPVHAVCDRLVRLGPEELEAEAKALLSDSAPVDAASAPLLMAALQVYWVDLASRVQADDVVYQGASGVCPVCGTAPVASIVRADAASQGNRYLHCALCATEWHMVRITCSHCLGTKGIDYRSIEGGSEAIRAECCESCRTYRKILYQEKDNAVEPLADDLASLPLDLLLSEAGYRRASGNPLLWQPPSSPG